jgi:hypothetical protein
VDYSEKPESGFFRKPDADGSVGERRPWEREFPREEIAYLLAGRRFVDLLARLEDLRSRYPYDVELLKSVRVLEWYLRPRMSRHAG